MRRRFPTLSRNAHRGSKPRCHLLTDGSPESVAARLTALAAPFAVVTPTDQWMPGGFADPAEAELDKAARLLDAGRRKELAAWWLPAHCQDRRTPNFDIASTCTVGGKRGLLLVEAKAHDEELIKETAGRVLAEDASENRRASHPTIGEAIHAACEGLKATTGEAWRLSRDSHYQISNRFAWSWKLTDLRVPVVLVYLGFLRADEMRDKGAPFADHAAWEATVRRHCEGVMASVIWGQVSTVNGQSFVPLIRSLEVPLLSRLSG
jgi:hypothetical protein